MPILHRSNERLIGQEFVCHDEDSYVRHWSQRMLQRTVRLNVAFGEFLLNKETPQIY